MLVSALKTQLFRNSRASLSASWQAWLDQHSKRDMSTANVQVQQVRVVWKCSEGCGMACICVGTCGSERAEVYEGPLVVIGPSIFQPAPATHDCVVHVCAGAQRMGVHA
eukprot:scaffold106210_cov14-Tisochrysis_lutea.AAC.1